MVTRAEIELLGEDFPGKLVENEPGKVVLSESIDSTLEELRIYVWTSEHSTTRAGALLEVIGNKTVKLTGQYSFRYDPPRTASTGSGQAPKGDFHLYSGDVEIAAWDSESKARHGFTAGTKLPKKAYDALIAKYPGMHGLKGRLLEHCETAVSQAKTSFSIALDENPAPDPSE